MRTTTKPQRHISSAGPFRPESLVCDVLERARHGCRAVTTSLLRVCDLQVLERDPSAPMPPDRSDSGLSYRRCEERDFEAFRGIAMEWSALRRLFQSRIRRGQICIGCFDGPRGVGYLWLAAAPERDRALGLHIRPSRDELYAFDLFVGTEYRRRGAGFGLIREWLLEARALGKARAVGIVRSSNLPMLMLIRAGFGFRHVHRITAAQFGRRIGIVFRGRAERLT